MILKRISGRSAIAQSVGTAEATSQRPKPISTPNPFETSAPSGLATIAVSHRADETLRLAMPEYIRNAPSFRRDGLDGVAPAASATDSASGYSTPERAVLLGNAGAITASSRKIEYESPSVERPNRLTIQCPPRAPRPHLTTALATRNATTMSTIVPLANPAYASSGLSRRLSTAKAIAKTDEVR